MPLGIKKDTDRLGVQISPAGDTYFANTVRKCLLYSAFLKTENPSKRSSSKGTKINMLGSLR